VAVLVGADSVVEAEPVTEPVVEAVSVVEAEPEAVSEVEAEAVSEVEAEAVSEVEAEAVSEVEAEAVSEVDWLTETVLEAVSEAEVVLAVSWGTQSQAFRASCRLPQTSSTGERSQLGTSIEAQNAARSARFLTRR
jgi:hypothetical protein